MDVEKFTHILKNNKASVTSARLAVFATLLESDSPLKKSDVATRTPSIDRASSYRALELFEKLGIITIAVRGWTPFVELAEPFKMHHHHMQCTSCGIVSRLDSDKLEELIRKIAKTHGYQLASHHIELMGVCRRCQLVSLTTTTKVAA